MHQETRGFRTMPASIPPSEVQSHGSSGSPAGESRMRFEKIDSGVGRPSASQIAEGPRRSSEPVLQAVADLFRDLNQQRIRYCHWKSNIRLQKSLQGRTDLDLLVDRRNIPAFRQILHSHGIKPVLAAPGRDYPAVENHLGLDLASGKLFHLHVHYQLVLGEQFVKNYRLPLESHFLNSVRLRHDVKIPSAELEIAILSLRALLKYRFRDYLRDVLSIRSSGLPAGILQEIDTLLQQTSLERIAQLLPTVADTVPADVVLEFLQTVVRNPRDAFALYRLRRRVRRALHSCQRDSRLVASSRYVHQLWRRRKRFRYQPQRKMTLPAGGVTLALIGADGAGKSTVCQILVQWLSWKLDVRRYYLGSKQPSRRSSLLYLVYRAFRRVHRSVGHALGEANLLPRWIAGLRDSLLCLHHLSIGYDRYSRYCAGTKKALGGSIVIFDRCPLESVDLGPGLRHMDGPQIPSLLEARNGSIFRAFAGVEQRLYRKIHPPEFLFVLEVSPEVSHQRKPDHQPATLAAKSRAVAAFTSLVSDGNHQLNLFSIDANRPLDEVLSQLKTRIWELL